ncbi:MAG: metabolite traffic protein EboE [Cyanobacteria bacterium P01_H01_bin.162]
MRLHHDRLYHLTYCTNIHPGEDWERVFQNLKTYIPPLKSVLAPDTSFGIGLRLASLASEALLAGSALAELQAWLAAQDCYVFTLNGFPYGGFHDQVVKDQVYAPDWSKRDRLTYTQRLIAILTTLLPSGVDGGISTVPLSYKPWWQGNSSKQAVIFERSSLHLAQIAAELAQVESEQGKYLHLDLEPEPDALLENADEVITFFQDWLLPIGQAYLQQQHGLKAVTAESWLRRYIRVCYDTCHFAVEFEDPTLALTKLRDAGIGIGKLQLSSAIRIPLPGTAPERTLLRQQLTPFAESTYLHQVIEQRSSGKLHHYTDLTEALSQLVEADATEWRTHFHVPIFIDRYPPFSSTQDHITAVLLQLNAIPDCTHLEIETYTWEVLPPDIKLDILASIQREYEWVLSSLPQPLAV